MKKHLIIMALAATTGFGALAAAQAASVQTITLSPACTDPADKVCPVKVQYDANPTAAQAGNQLNGISLKEIDLGQPTKGDLERFRKFLEQERRKAQSEYKKVIYAYDHSKAGKDELEAAKARYEEALVNYNHGIYAYQVAVGTRD